MKYNSVMVKLWGAIIITILFILFMSMVFQTSFLSSFYYEEKIKSVKENAEDIARALGRNEYNFNIYVDAIRNVNDVIVVTDDGGRITYITGTTEYKKTGFWTQIFGQDFEGRIHP